MRQWDEAEIALRRALKVDPNAVDYLHAMADHYLRRGQLQAAGRIAERMVEKHPGHPLGHRILRFIEREINRRSDQ
jgi:predicted Zn-dependent protease